MKVPVDSCDDTHELSARSLRQDMTSPSPETGQARHIHVRTLDCI